MRKVTLIIGIIVALMAVSCTNYTCPTYATTDCYEEATKEAL